MILVERKAADPMCPEINMKISVPVLRREVGVGVPEPSDRTIARKLRTRNRRACCADVNDRSVSIGIIGAGARWSGRVLPIDGRPGMHKPEQCARHLRAAVAWVGK